jgi:hypothetical protein
MEGELQTPQQLLAYIVAIIFTYPLLQIPTSILEHFKYLMHPIFYQIKVHNDIPVYGALENNHAFQVGGT